MKFSYIIGYRQACESRRKNFEKVIENLEKNKSNFEVIVVEQDETQKLPGNLFYKHIFAYNKGLYNRSWAFNIGAKFSESNVLIFADCDIMIDFNDLQEAIEQCKAYDTIDPKKRVIDYNEDGSLGAIRNGVVFSGGIVLINKQAFYKVNGWDEEFVGWGGEDNAMTIKLHRFLTYKRLDFDVFHLYHNDRFTSAPRHEMYFRLNEAKWKNLEKMSNEQMIDKYKDVLIGDENKYKEKT